MKHTKLLFHSIESISRAVELKELLKKSLDAVCTVLHTEASTLMLLDKSTGKLDVSIPTGPVKGEITGYSIPKDKGISGWVIKNNKEYLCNDVSKDSVFWKDISEEFKTRSILCVPLRDRKGEAYGVLQAVNKEKDLEFKDGDINTFMILAEHISLAIQRANEHEEMKAKLETKSLLLSETHHRLKNNLFAISALMELESSRVTTIGSSEVLKKASARLNSIAHLHSLLYQNDNSNEVRFREFLEKLIEEVSRIYHQEEKEIQIQAEIDDMELPADQCILCGLTLNELLINAYKHAFLGRDRGLIKIRIRNIANEKIIIDLSDDGLGMVDSNKQKDHMFVVNAFVQQMGASITNETGSLGTTFGIEIPL